MNRNRHYQSFRRLETWELIGSEFEAKNWMLVTRKTTNHIHVLVLGNEWLKEKPTATVLQIKCIPSAIRHYTIRGYACLCTEYYTQCCLVCAFVPIMQLIYNFCSFYANTPHTYRKEIAHRWEYHRFWSTRSSIRCGTHIEIIIEWIMVVEETKIRCIFLQIKGEKGIINESMSALNCDKNRPCQNRRALSTIFCHH